MILYRPRQLIGSIFAERYEAFLNYVFNVDIVNRSFINAGAVSRRELIQTNFDQVKPLLVQPSR